MTTYALSPSLLTFEYNSCKRCFWLQARKVWKKPPQPFPRVFTAIDRCMRECYHQTDVRLIAPDLPPGIIDTTERTITSAPIQFSGQRSSLTFSGKVDALVHFADGTVGIIDFKTTDTKDEQLAFYSRQLHAYRHILKYPIALRNHVRTLFESSINTIAKVIKLIPALSHPIFQHKPPMLNLV